MVPSMKNPQNANKVAGQDVKVLPVDASQAEREKILPSTPEGASARGLDSRVADWNFLPADGGAHAAAWSAVPSLQVLDLPSLAEARLRALDRAHDMVALHAVRLVESQADALSVVIKPSVGTELALELRQHGGAIEAQARLLRGDHEFLSQHWSELQQRLEQRGIKLSLLGGGTDFAGNNPGQSRSGFGSEEQVAQQASAFAEFAAMTPAGGASARLAVVPEGWESWA